MQRQHPLILAICLPNTFQVADEQREEIRPSNSKLMRRIQLQKVLHEKLTGIESHYF